MNRNIKSAQGRNRSFGLEGSGKGDSDRTSDTNAYNARLAEVAFPRLHPSADGFAKSKRGWKKIYGQSRLQSCPAAV